MMNTITPKEALQGRKYAIVEAKSGQIYDLYRDKDTAKRVADDLNKRYGDASYYAAKVDFGEEK